MYISRHPLKSVKRFMGRQSNVEQLFHHHDSSHEPDKAVRLIRVLWGSCLVIALVFLPHASSTVVHAVLMVGLLSWSLHL